MAKKSIILLTILLTICRKMGLPDKHIASGKKVAKENNTLAPSLIAIMTMGQNPVRGYNIDFISSLSELIFSIL
jgi:hypothetical protein